MFTESTEGFLKGIERFRGLVGERAQEGVVLYDGVERFRVKGVRVENMLLHGGVEEILGGAGNVRVEAEALWNPT